MTLKAPLGMEHKAYEFNWENFNAELRSIMESSLSSGEIDLLTKFIEKNLSYLSDPYEGETLEENWKDLLGENSVQELADFALTKYY